MRRRKGANATILIAENVCMKVARDIIAGAFRYSATNPKWSMVVYGIHVLDQDAMRKFSRPDGIITGYSDDDPANPVPRELRRDIPTVFTCVDPASGMRAPFATISADDIAIADAAARCLQKNNLEHFAFIGTSRNSEWQTSRLTRFRDAIAKSGNSVSVFITSCKKTKSWDAERMEILRWIESMPKPCGIFAANDAQARIVLDICREAEINVPAQVQVIGVDNETYFCEYSAPTMSSISPDFEGGGFLAAQTLDALLERKKPPLTLTFGIAEIVERSSTSDISGAGNRVARARDIIRSEIKSQISVSAIAHRIGCSTRLLEKDFRSVLGRTVVGEIGRVRLTKARDMLKHTQKSEESIAAACGYGSLGTLRNAFRSQYGMSIRKWRLSETHGREI